MNLRVPIDPAGTNGINIGNAGDFRIWFYVQPAAVISGGTIAYIPYTLPRSSGNVVTLVAQQTFSGLVFPATTLWAPAGLQAPEVEAACHPTGISLASRHRHDQRAEFENQSVLPKYVLCGPNEQ